MMIWVFGPRDLNPDLFVQHVLSVILEEYGCTDVIHGGARGVDETAGLVAQAMGLNVVVVPADWEQFGRRAGILRNVQMARQVSVAAGRAICIKEVAETQARHTRFGCVKS